MKYIDKHVYFGIALFIFSILFFGYRFLTEGVDIYRIQNALMLIRASILYTLAILIINKKMLEKQVSKNLLFTPYS